MTWVPGFLLTMLHSLFRYFWVFVEGLKQVIFNVIIITVTVVKGPSDESFKATWSERSVVVYNKCYLQFKATCLLLPLSQCKKGWSFNTGLTVLYMIIHVCVRYSQNHHVSFNPFHFTATLKMLHTCVWVTNIKHRNYLPPIFSWYFWFLALASANSSCCKYIKWHILFTVHCYLDVQA